MPQPTETSAVPTRTVPSGPELFVYLSWQTRGNKPLLADDEIQQATYQAIGTRTRLRRCHLLAIAGNKTRIYTVFRFPASFPVSLLAQISMEAAEEAIVRLHMILYGGPKTACSFWEREYVLKTLNTDDILQPRDFLRKQMQEAEQIPSG